MATRPHGPMRGHGGSTIARLTKLLAHHDEAASAIRFTLGLLNGAEKVAKQNGHAPVIAAALGIDGARRERKRKGGKRNGAGRPPASDAVKRRRATVKFLARFSRTTPRPGGIGISIYAQHGYVRKKGDGYIRTDKPLPFEA